MEGEWQESRGVVVFASTVRMPMANGLCGCKAPRQPLLTEAQAKGESDGLENIFNGQQNSDKDFQLALITFTIKSHSGTNYVRRRRGEDCLQVNAPLL